jgi:hypothetical protein
MRVSIDGNDYQISFEYDSTQAVTTCFVKKGPKGCNFRDMKQLSVGRALRSSADRFCKEIGRKVSLKRALGEGFQKPFRKSIWEAYRARRQGILALPK